jgi:hypothetical protein
MTRQSSNPSRHVFWRLLLLSLAVVPFLPIIVISLTSAFAQAAGCKLDQQEACDVASLPASKIISLALQACAGWVMTASRADERWLYVFHASVSAWLCLCLVVMSLGWRSIRSRLRLGLAIVMGFAILPYFGPAMATAHLVYDKCAQNAGRVGACMLFGGRVGTEQYNPMHEALIIANQAGNGFGLVLTIFAVYLAIVTIIWIGSNRRRGQIVE